jgi:drug/metabolite transporter (DMT)-like permease
LLSAAVRFYLSVVVLWITLLVSRQRLPFRLMRKTVVPGVAMAVNFAAFFAAVNHASIAVLSVILALQPAFVLLFAWVALRERASRAQIGWTVVGMLGVAVVILGGNPKVTGDGLGVALGVVALLGYVVYYLSGRHVRSSSEISALQWMAGVTTIAAVTMTPVVLVSASPSDLGRFGVADLAYLFFMAAIVAAVGHTLLGWAHRYVPAARSSIIMLASNVVAVSMAWPLNHQPVTGWQVVGGAIVLGSVAAVITANRQPVAELALETA